MTCYARIENNKVSEIINTDNIIGKYHSSLVFMECDNLTKVGDTLGIVDGSTVIVSHPTKTIDQLKQEKTIEIRGFVAPSITSGISCNALGADHTYPTTRDDQGNINGLVTETILPDAGDEYKFWCADSLGVWERRVHTLEQIRVVGLAIANKVKTNQEKYESKLAAIGAATTKEQLDLITWD